MLNFHKNITRVVNRFETWIDNLRYRKYRTRLGNKPLLIQPYRGYGTTEKVFIKGRVLVDKRITNHNTQLNLLQNLQNMYKRMESDEIPFARVRVSFQDIQEEIVADEEGYFTAWLHISSPIRPKGEWLSGQSVLIQPLPGDGEPAKANINILIPPDNASLGVISDIDDTVLIAYAQNPLRMLHTVFLANPLQRSSFEGVAAFYQGLHNGRDGNNHNPIFYVSSSPWNLHDILCDALQRAGLPIGPLLLRDWGISTNEILPFVHQAYKKESISQVLDLYPNLPFILIGDNSQEDPLIYQTLVEKYTPRILAVYIRVIDHSAGRLAMLELISVQVKQYGSSLIRVDHTLEMAEHAAQQGWISPIVLGSFPSSKSVTHEQTTARKNIAL